MKMNLRLIIFILSVLLGSQTFAQQNIVRANPLKLLAFRTAEVGYERFISAQFSAGLNVQFIIPRNYNNTIARLGLPLEADEYTIERTGLSGFRISPEFRYYFSKNAPEGLYAGGFLRLSGQTFLSTVDIRSGLGSGEVSVGLRFIGGGGGLDMGYQKFIGKHFLIDYRVGVGVSAPGIFLIGSLGELDIEPVNDFLDDVEQRLAMEFPRIFGRENNPLSIPVSLATNELERNFSVPLGSVVLPIFRSVLSVGYYF